MSDDLLDDLMDFHEETKVEKVNRSATVRAAFVIPGSKNRSIKHIMQHLPYRKKWVDHFCGSGIVTFNRTTSSHLMVMNDRYGAITAFYRCLKNPVKKQQLIDLLELQQHCREDFYHYRDTWVTETDDVARAAQWWFVIRASVIGKGDCFGRVTNSRFCNFLPGSLKLFEPLHHRLKHVQIENLDFEQCHKDYDSFDAVHYFDPPYIGTDGSVYEHKWTRDDLSRLLRTIGNSKGFCALSGYKDEQIMGEKFWTERYEWEVPANAEVQAYTEENYKLKHSSVQRVDRAKECLWIKEVV